MNGLKKETVTTIAALIEATRTCRRFYEQEEVSLVTLHELIDLARLGGSARNLQPLKYKPVNKASINAGIFPHLGWAGYLPEWSGPAAGERPAAYIICLLDTRLADEAACDLGIATQNILLGATARGLGGCRIGSFCPTLRSVLDIPDYLGIMLVLALGRPRETVVLDEAEAGGDVRYWRDDRLTHHVPKRSLAEIIIS